MLRMAKRMSAHDGRIYTIAVAVAALILGGWMYWAAESRIPEVTGSTTATETGLRYLGPPGGDKPWVYFVGDSFAEGTPNDAGTTWPDYVTQGRGWYERNIATGGSGYVVAGGAGQTYFQSVNRSKLDRAQMIVLSGGYNDRDVPADVFRSNAHDVFTRVKELAPNVPIVALSTFYTRGELPATMAVENDILRAEAGIVGAQYIDVSSLFLNRPDAVGVDGTHPNDIGQRLIADTLIGQLPDPAPKAP